MSELLPESEAVPMGLEELEGWILDRAFELSHLDGYVEKSNEQYRKVLWQFAEAWRRLQQAHDPAIFLKENGY